MSEEEIRALKELEYDLKEHKTKYAKNYEDVCYSSLIELQQENENLRSTIKNDDVAVNNLCKEIENLKQQLKDKDEKISKAVEYCNGSAFEVSTREYGMLNVINYEDVLEILESNKED